MKQRLLEHLRAGGRVGVSVITRADATVDGESKPVDLCLEAARRLVENAALFAVPADVVIENLPGRSDPRP